MQQSGTGAPVHTVHTCVKAKDGHWTGHSENKLSQ